MGLQQNRQLRGKKISELEDMQNETQMGRKELKNSAPEAEGQYQAI